MTFLSRIIRVFCAHLPNAQSFIPVCLFFLLLAHCTPPKTTRPPVGGRPNTPVPAKPGNKPSAPMDTVRWTTPANPKPPIGANPQTGTQPLGDTYRIAYLLPFLTNQAADGSVPERSRLGLQFYSGAKIALQKISEEGGINLQVDVFDTQTADADFQRLLADPKLAKANTLIGPIRSSHVSAIAAWAKNNRKILISPETPNMDLATQNPDFLQINPSLRAHCVAITNYVLRKHRSDAVTLVCKQKEADRLPFFQNNIPAGGRFTELIVPDETLNFDKIDLKPFLKTGRTSVFILPSWASQDFVMAFLRRLKTVKGAARAEVYGMPQWKNFESIETEYLSALNVHISAASYIDYSAQEVKDFQRAFYEATGTIPDEDAFKGYDVTLFTGRMLKRFGLSFPERLPGERYKGFHSDFWFSKIFGSANIDNGLNRYDYLENTFLHILKFDEYGFRPVAN